MRELEEGTALELRSHASADEEDVTEARKLGVRTLHYLYRTYGRKRARSLVPNKASYVLGYIDGRLATRAEAAPGADELEACVRYLLSNYVEMPEGHFTFPDGETYTEEADND